MWRASHLLKMKTKFIQPCFGRESPCTDVKRSSKCANKAPVSQFTDVNNNTLFRNEDNTVNCRQDDLEISVFLVIISKKREISPLLREG